VGLKAILQHGILGWKATLEHGMIEAPYCELCFDNHTDDALSSSSLFAFNKSFSGLSRIPHSIYMELLGTSFIMKEFHSC
jgi:hypothetical protein